MYRIFQSEHSTALDYIHIVLEKTKNNHDLALIIFKKLFAELPEQLDRIEDRLTVEDFENAREITHKMHGSVSFCGLTEIQEPTKKLEQCLLNNNYEKASKYLLQLKQKVSTFMRYQDRILVGLSENAMQ